MNVCRNLGAFLTARGKCGELAGVLPLVEQSSAFCGRFLVSLPFFTYGGIPDENSAAYSPDTVSTEQRG
jgi:hypothetical protein